MTMRLTVFGATGGIGGAIVRQALDAGHQVTAVVRDPVRLAVPAHARLEAVTADVTDRAAIAQAVAGRDAVLSGVGSRTRRPDGIAAKATRSVLEAMDTTGVRRLVVVSAGPVGPTPPDEPWFARAVFIPLLSRVLREVYADLAEMEDELRRSAAEWTSVRPPRLTDGPLTGAYRTAIGANPVRMRTISRADVAHAMLAVLENPATVKTAVGVTY